MTRSVDIIELAVAGAARNFSRSRAPTKKAASSALISPPPSDFPTCIARSTVRLDVQRSASSRFGRSPHPSYAATRLMGDRVFSVCRRAAQAARPVKSSELPARRCRCCTILGERWRRQQQRVARLARLLSTDQMLSCHAGQRFSEASVLIDAATLGFRVAFAAANLVVDPARRIAPWCAR